MNKPLELTVYAEGGCVTAADCVLKEWCIECVEEQDKRLTDAELAAEVHSAVLGAYRAKVHAGEPGRDIDQMQTLRRFATHPHASENQENR